MRAGLVLGRLEVVGAVNFLADTGADHTSLHPKDIGILGIDYAKLLPDNLSRSQGVGGQAAYIANLRWSIL